MAPLPPSNSRSSGDTATSRLLTTLQLRPLSHTCTIIPWHRSLLHSEMEPSPWTGFATCYDIVPYMTIMLSLLFMYHLLLSAFLSPYNNCIHIYIHVSTIYH